jgi:hypothetical protein
LFLIHISLVNSGDWRKGCLELKPWRPEGNIMWLIVFSCSRHFIVITNDILAGSSVILELEASIANAAV